MNRRMFIIVLVMMFLAPVDLTAGKKTYKFLVFKQKVNPELTGQELVAWNLQQIEQKKAFDQKIEELKNSCSLSIECVKIASPDEYYALIIQDPTDRKRDDLQKLIIPPLQAMGFQETQPRP